MSVPRVLITRSPHQASALADQLRAHGIEPILIPTIELAEPTTFAPLDAALSHLDTFHWLIFTSTNAVEAFHRRFTGRIKKPSPGSPAEPDTPTPESSKGLGAPGPDSRTRVMLPPNLKIAAIGPTTARALAAASLSVDLLPPQAVAESLAEKLLPHAHQPDGTPTRFLLLRAELARELLPDTLRSAGSEVTIAPVYRNILPSESITAMHTLFSSRDQWPNAITFTSSSTATNLVALLEAASLSLSEEVMRISIGPITSQTLRDLNLPPHAVADESSLPGLVAAVVKALHLKESKQAAYSKREEISKNLA